jgi:outer membrane receptor protein involved in Fe transport
MYVRGSYSWQDESRNQLEEFAGGIKVVEGNLATYIQPSFGIADMRVGIRNDEWTLEGFVSNLTDERAVLFNDPYFMDSFWGSRRVITNRPREFGVRFSYSWY